MVDLLVQVGNCDCVSSVWKPFSKMHVAIGLSKHKSQVQFSYLQIKLMNIVTDSWSLINKKKCWYRTTSNRSTSRIVACKCSNRVFHCFGTFGHNNNINQGVLRLMAVDPWWPWTLDDRGPLMAVDPWWPWSALIQKIVLSSILWTNQWRTRRRVYVPPLQTTSVHDVPEGSKTVKNPVSSHPSSQGQ